MDRIPTKIKFLNCISSFESTSYETDDEFSFFNGFNQPATPLKVTSAIKHRNTAEEIMIYVHRVYSLLLKLEKNKV